MAFDMVRFLAEQSNKVGDTVAQLGRKGLDFSTLPTYYQDQLEIWDCREVSSTQSVVGTTMIWGNDTYGIWGTGSWNTSSSLDDYEVVQVRNAHNKFPEGFWNNRFISDVSTGSENLTDYEYAIGSGELLQTTEIYLGSDQLSTISLQASGSLLDELDIYATADGGNNWEQIELNSVNSFISIGSDLRLKFINTDVNNPIITDFLATYQFIE